MSDVGLMYYGTTWCALLIGLTAFFSRALISSSSVRGVSWARSAIWGGIFAVITWVVVFVYLDGYNYFEV